MKKILFVCTILMILVSCKKQVVKVSPSITSAASTSSVTATSATINGAISDDGGDPITARGVVYGLSPNPTISDSKTSDGTGIGSFNSIISGLLPGKTYYVRIYATNSIGTTYGDQVTITTTKVAPTIGAGTSNSSITTTSAIITGSVAADGGDAITAKGVVYSLTNPPTISDSKTNEGAGTGNFTSTITGLSPGKVYYFRTYATNSMGTTYGDLITLTSPAILPTVATTAASNVTSSTAASGGSISNDGGANITAKGVCWGTAQNPTTALTTKTNEGSGTTTFTSAITGLSPNTVYYARAYATNSVGTNYGTQVTFTTPAAGPTVATSAITAITSTTATGGGNVTLDGGSAVTARGICWSTSTGPTTALITKTSNNTGTGVFESLMTGLSPGTTYFVRAYATNSVATTYGPEITFATQAAGPTVTTASITAITSTTATGGGNVTSDGGATVTARGICWSNSTGPTTALTTKTSNNSGTGAFTSLITGLTPGTTYYVRAYATNSAGTAYGVEISFTSTSTNGIIFNPNLSYGSLTDVDANIYKTIQIGTQIWMAENLKTTKYKDGTAIPLVTDNYAWDNLVTPSYCWYDNAISNKATYGALYNWYTVNTGKLCPTGWHVPTDAEWTILTSYLGGNSVAGGKLKEAGTSHWQSTTIDDNNISGFTALPGDERLYGDFEGLDGIYGFWWSSTEGSTTYAWQCFLQSYTSGISRVNYEKKSGNSVRCLKD